MKSNDEWIAEKEDPCLPTNVYGWTSTTVFEKGNGVTRRSIRIESYAFC